MADVVMATLHASRDGIDYVGQSREYSVAMYCYTMLDECSSDEHAALRRLLVDLLTYGGKAQAYAGYGDDVAVDASLSDEQRAWGTCETPTLESITDLRYRVANDPIAQWTGVELYLHNDVSMRIKFTTENAQGLTLRVKTSRGEWQFPSSEWMSVDGDYAVLFNGISATQMSDAVYVTVCRGNIPVSHTLRYSVESYACAQQKGGDTALNELLDAMMCYGNSAKAYNG